MRKYESLRSALVAAAPELEHHADRLAVYVEQGRCAARLGPVDAQGISGFEYRYRAVAILVDYAGDANRIFLALLEWLREHQPEILLNPESTNQALSFDVDPLDDRKVDIQLQVELSEAIDVAPNGTMTYRAEPPVDDGFIDVPFGTPLGEVASNGERILP